MRTVLAAIALTLVLVVQDRGALRWSQRFVALALAAAALMVYADLPSFAAITDEPPAEVAAAGHDRCVVPIKPEHLDAWLRPDPADLARSTRSSTTGSGRIASIAARHSLSLLAAL